MERQLPKCPVEVALYMIGDKWTFLIIRELVRARGKALRYSEIKNNINKISDKMLSQNLRRLEDEKLIEKKVFAQVPPKVEYSLTELGQTLTSVIRALFNWGEMYINYVKENENE